MKGFNVLMFDIDDSFNFNIKKTPPSDEEMLAFLNKMMCFFECTNSSDFNWFYNILVDKSKNGFAKEWEVFLRKNGYIK